MVDLTKAPKMPTRGVEAFRPADYRFDMLELFRRYPKLLEAAQAKKDRGEFLPGQMHSYTEGLIVRLGIAALLAEEADPAKREARMELDYLAACERVDQARDAEAQRLADEETARQAAEDRRATQARQAAEAAAEQRRLADAAAKQADVERQAQLDSYETERREREERLAKLRGEGVVVM